MNDFTSTSYLEDNTGQSKAKKGQTNIKKPKPGQKGQKGLSGQVS